MIRKRICLILAGIVLLFSTVFPSVADEPMYLEYAYGHTWQVWLPGVYEALKFILPAYSIDYEIHCSMLYRLTSKTVPHPCLFGRMQNR